jgi:transcriptional regulator with XRE-family HTH domain
MLGELNLFVSNALRRKRLAARLSVDELARMTGIPAERLSEYEANLKPMDFPALQTIAEALDGDVLDFVNGFVAGNRKSHEGASDG